jgi:hypothetical protein
MTATWVAAVEGVLQDPVRDVKGKMDHRITGGPLDLGLRGNHQLSRLSTTHNRSKMLAGNPIKT